MNGVGVGQRPKGRSATGVALVLLTLLAAGCGGVRVPTVEDDQQLVGAVSIAGSWILSPDESPASGEVLLVPMEQRETLLADTLADQHDWNDERLRDTGAWNIPMDQVDAAEGRVVSIDDHGGFVFDDVEPGPKFVCQGGERSPSGDFGARGCLEVDVRPPMAIRLTSVEGQLQLDVLDSA